MDDDKNCGVCVSSSAADGRFCERWEVVNNGTAKGLPIAVGIARSASMSACGPDGLLFEPCQCLDPFCVRHGKDRRR